MSRYLVRHAKPWGYLALEALRARLPEHEWTEIDVGDFDAAFVLHWSGIIPPAALARCPHVGFHLGDLPRCRGGSPLQHLIADGAQHTVLNAFLLTDQLDAGEVLLTWPVQLGGSAEECYLRADRGAVEMVQSLVEHPVLLAQGEPQVDPEDGVFQEVGWRKRRTPAESRVPEPGWRGLLGLHDHVRMLDAATYPPAFVEVDGWRIELTRSALRHDHVACDARVTRVQP